MPKKSKPKKRIRTKASAEDNHYWYLRKKEKYKDVPAIRLVNPERFWSKVHMLGTEDCWEWCGRIDEQGYGDYVPIANKHIRAHRAAYEFSNGPIEEGASIIQTCENRACCNPFHLQQTFESPSLRRKPKKKGKKK